MDLLKVSYISNEIVDMGSLEIGCDVCILIEWFGIGLSILLYWKIYLMI